jgi:signal transduction histidine kinase/CheY-like chemotaxis protein
MDKLTRFYIIPLLLLFPVKLTLASDTLFVKNTVNIVDLKNCIQVVEDTQDTFNINTLLDKGHDIAYRPYDLSELNFNYSRSTFWIRFIVKNETGAHMDYFLEVANPDLDFVSFYETKDDSVVRSRRTGELFDVHTREVFNRNYLFNISLFPGEYRTYYLAVNNNGHPCTVPLKLKERTYFERNNIISDTFNWAIYGLLIFIVLFNFYQYWALKDRVNLYYSLSLLFAIITFMYYDGYLYLFNPPKIVENLKWVSASLYSIFLLLFTQWFIPVHMNRKVVNWFLTPVKVITLIASFAYIMKYPLSLMADIGIPLFVLIVFIAIIILTWTSYKKDYLPIRLYVFAYIAVFIGLLFHLLKELDFIRASYPVINSIKIGLTVQNILLMIAVLERFRINQRNDKQTIQKNLMKIERQNQELEIINTELEKLSIVASETDNSIAIFNNDGRLEWANSGFEKLYDVNINDLIRNKKDSIEKVIPNAEISKYVDMCRESRTSVIFETRIAPDENKETWIQTTLSPFIRSGAISKIISIDSDITRLKTYEKELESAKAQAEESDRLKTAFLHNISHEIRTPMNAIVGFSGFLNNPDLQFEERRQYSDIIVQSTNQLLSIITDIINIASIEAGQESITESQISLNRTMKYIHEQMLIKVAQKDINLELKLPSPLQEIKVLTDETKLIQVFTNLIDNALKFTIKGNVVFGYEIRANEIEFFVSDTGVGIDPSFHKEIFKRFRQVENSLPQHIGGSGLGLSISKAYVELMGGKIWVNSRLKEGSTFFFTIPCKIAESAVPDKRVPQQKRVRRSPKNQITVLIVEDEKSNYLLLKEFLSEMIPNVLHARNGLEAVEICKSGSVDLILMDMRMPEMDGFEATRQIRQFLPHLPIIAQTAYYNKKDMEKAMHYGCNEFISKPIKRDKLISMINELVSDTYETNGTRS